MKKLLFTTFTIIAILIFILWLLLYFEVGKKEYTAEEWKAKSIEKASTLLDDYIEQEGLTRRDFTGPYSKRSGYDPRGKTYTTCYKSETHHFCYHQAGHLAHGYLISEVNCDTPICQWLKSQP